MEKQVMADMRHKISEKYDLGEIKVFEPCWLQGLSGDSLYLEAESGRFVFKVMGKEVNDGQARFIFDILKFLEGFEVKVPKVFVSAEGEKFLHPSDIFPGRLGMLFSFTPVDFWPQHQMEERYFREVVEETACLHLALKSYSGEKPKRKRRFLDSWEENLRGIKRLWLNNPLQLSTRELSSGKEALALAAECLSNQAERGRGKWPYQPAQLIHGDLNKYNFLFYKGHLSGIIDFDDILLGLVEDDWAVLLAGLFSPGDTTLSWNRCWEIIRSTGTHVDEEGVKIQTIAFLLSLILRCWKVPDSTEERSLLSVWYNNAVERILSLLS